MVDLLFCFSLHKILLYGRGSLHVNYWDTFISCLDSHWWYRFTAEDTLVSKWFLKVTLSAPHAPPGKRHRSRMWLWATPRSEKTIIQPRGLGTGRSVDLQADSHGLPGQVCPLALGPVCISHPRTHLQRVGGPDTEDNDRLRHPQRGNDRDQEDTDGKAAKIWWVDAPVALLYTYARGVAQVYKIHKPISLAFSLIVWDDWGSQVSPLCRHDITRSDQQIGNKIIYILDGLHSECIFC